MTPDNPPEWVTYAITQIVTIVTAWPPAIAVALVLLRNEVRQVANALVNRVLNPEQPFSFGAGPVHADFPGRIPSDAETKAALPPDEPVDASVDETLGDVNKALAESESRTNFWHFAFLSRYLTLHAIEIIRSVRVTPLHLERIWEAFSAAVPSESRGATLASLTAHDLVSLDGSMLVATDRGRRFLDWLAGPHFSQEQGLTPPLIAYGSGLPAGSIVEVLCDNRVLARAVADHDGRWLLKVVINTSLGPVQNTPIFFRANGVYTHFAFWRGGGVPNDPQGIDLRLDKDQKITQAEFVSGPVSIEGVTAESEAEFAEFLRGKNSRHVLATSNGQMVSYVLDAPGFVNTGFRSAFPDMRLAQTLVILVAARDL